MAILMLINANITKLLNFDSSHQFAVVELVAESLDNVFLALPY